MAIVIEAGTQRRIKIDPDVARLYSEEINNGQIIPFRNNAMGNPGWADKTSPRIAEQTHPVLDSFFGIEAGISYTKVTERSVRTGIVTGIQMINPGEGDIRVIAIEDVGENRVKEVKYPWDLVNNGGGKGMRLDLDIPTPADLTGLNRVFTIGRIIERNLCRKNN